MAAVEASIPACPEKTVAGAIDKQVEEHIWLIYNGETYHVPMTFVRRHPKGRQLILPYANRDMTEAYDNAGHSKGAMRTLLKYANGSLSVAEVQRVYAAQREVHDQAVWNWCVRVGSLLSVAAVLGAVCVRCRQQA